jgi:hypothetical protein
MSAQCGVLYNSRVCFMCLAYSCAYNLRYSYVKILITTITNYTAQLQVKLQPTWFFLSHHLFNKMSTSVGSYFWRIAPALTFIVSRVSSAQIASESFNSCLKYFNFSPISQNKYFFISVIFEPGRMWKYFCIS